MAQKKPQTKSSPGSTKKDATNKEGNQKAGVKSRMKLVIAALSALGVISGIVAYYLPGILGSSANLIINRLPLDYNADLVLNTPNTFAFPNAVPPSTVPGWIMKEDDEDPAGAVQAFADWAEQHEGVGVAPQVRLILRARNASPVIITNLSVQIIREYSAKNGWFNIWYGCGGVVDVRTVAVNLDKHPFKAIWSDSSGVLKNPPTLSVTNTDNEVLAVQVFTARPVIIEWVINISYSTDGQEGNLRIDNHGKPFVVTSLLGSVAYSDRYGPQLVRDPSEDPGKPGIPLDGLGIC